MKVFPMSAIRLTAFLLAAIWFACATGQAAERPPNIIVIYADDLGWGDLGCYGNPSIRTPHLDTMAREGMRFTDFYSAAEVCTPSRAALLTGRYPVRNGMCHDKFRVLRNNSKGGLPKDEVTLPSLLKSRGYTTGCIGKWHLGHRPEHLPPRHGFDFYFGMPFSNDMMPAADAPKGRGKMFEENNAYWRTPLIRGLEVVDSQPDQRQLTRLYTEASLQFIHSHRSEPFFLYLAHSFPHVPLFASADFRGKSRGGIYGDVVEELDWSVGQVLGELRKLGLAENTLVVFSSDNGPWTLFDHHGGSAGPLREGKGSTWEGGMRVPGIFLWPGHIPAGVIQHKMASTMDVYVTAAKIAGAHLPSDRKIDGRDITPLLFAQKPAIEPEPFFYYRGSQLFAVRIGEWKAHLITQSGYGGDKAEAHDPPLLFHLGEDPGERWNRADKYPEILTRVREAVALHQKELLPAPSQLVDTE
jgi:arylsulfatase A